MYVKQLVLGLCIWIFIIIEIKIEKKIQMCINVLENNHKNPLHINITNRIL